MEKTLKFKVSPKEIKAADFDAKFAEGDVCEYLELKSVKIHHPNRLNPNVRESKK